MRRKKMGRGDVQAINSEAYSCADEGGAESRGYDRACETAAALGGRWGVYMQ